MSVATASTASRLLSSQSTTSPPDPQCCSRVSLFALCVAYLSCVEMLPKLVFSLVPMPFTTAMIDD